MNVSEANSTGDSQWNEEGSTSEFEDMLMDELRNQTTTPGPASSKTFVIDPATVSSILNLTSVDNEDNNFDREFDSQGLDLRLTGEFRLWMLLGLIFGILTALTILVCCFVRIRIPRTRRQIEAMSEWRKMRKKGLAPPFDGKAVGLLAFDATANQLPQSPRKVNNTNIDINMQSLEVPKRSKTPQSSGSGHYNDTQYTSAEEDLNEIGEQISVSHLEFDGHDVINADNRSQSGHVTQSFVDSDTAARSERHLRRPRDKKLRNNHQTKDGDSESQRYGGKEDFKRKPQYSDLGSQGSHYSGYSSHKTATPSPVSHRSDKKETVV